MLVKLAAWILRNHAENDFIDMKFQVAQLQRKNRLLRAEIKRLKDEHAVSGKAERVQD
jgi:hypothetical protein